MTNKLEIRKLAELACGTAKDSPEYGRFLAAMNPTLLLDLTAAPDVERQEPHQIHDCCANCLKGNDSHGDDGKCPSPFTTIWHAWDYDFAPNASPPAPVAADDLQAMQDRHDAWMAGVEQGKAEAVPEGWKLVPIEPTEAMLNVLHDRVLISVNSRKREANILNDKAWWRAVVESAPACLDKVKELNQ